MIQKTKYKNKLVTFLVTFFVCLYVFLCPFYVVFSQITVQGNAKFYIKSDTPLYINEEHFSNDVVYIHSENFIPHKKNKNSKSKKKTRQNLVKTIKIKKEDKYDNIPAKCEVQPFPAKYAYLFNNNLDHAVTFAQSNLHSKVFGKCLKGYYCFYFNISLRLVIDVGDIIYINRTLRFTYFIRPPPPSSIKTIQYLI